MGADKFEAAFFDFGGTLYSYRNKGIGLRDILIEFGKKLGITLSRDSMRSAYRKAALETSLEFMPRPYYLHRDMFMDTYRRFAEAFDASPNSELLDWCHEQQRDRVIKNFKLRDDCLSTLRKLRDAGLHVALVSNIDDDYLDPMVSRAGLDEVLHAWTSSEEAGSCKPDPEIFRVVVEKAGCDPARALFVGDSQSADIAGAHPLGMTTVLIREDGQATSESDGPEPHHTIAALEELLEIARV